ncbi:MAG TPA: hypothetical protein VGX68_02965 [Thermoanaerobaculia bacterium]|jgi:hypothetical protein|nr:hypothetical protein [Thermoanaerobaculia bacterium]
MRSDLLRQVGKQIVLGALALGLSYAAIWYPRSNILYQIQRDGWKLVGSIVASWLATWLAANAALVFWRRRRQQQPAGSESTLGKLTFWFGLAGALSLFTSFCLGWLALLLAPAGVVTGIMAWVREAKARAGHGPLNLLGVALCLGALAFLLE